MTHSRIAEWTFRERHNITTMVDRMRKDKLVRTERDKKDRRTINVILTEQGQQVLSQVLPAAGEVVNIIMSSISRSDYPHCEQLLGSMRQNAYGGLEKLKRKLPV